MKHVWFCYTYICYVKHESQKENKYCADIFLIIFIHHRTPVSLLWYWYQYHKKETTFHSNNIIVFNSSKIILVWRRILISYTYWCALRPCPRSPRKMRYLKLNNLSYSLHRNIIGSLYWIFYTTSVTSTIIIYPPTPRM